MLSEEDPAEPPLLSSHTIEVAEALPAGAVDPVLFDCSYVLQPQQVGLRVYCPLRDAMTDTGQIGLGRVTSAPANDWRSCAPTGRGSAWPHCCGPGGYRDRSREALQALIDAKLADRHGAVPASRTEETADLEETLRTSLARGSRTTEQQRQ